MDKKLAIALSNISANRKNPLLVLGVDEIDATFPLLIERALNGQSFKALDVLLQTGGGDIDAAYKAIRLIRNSSQKVSILIPFYAKSAGTLMCLGADELIMTQLSELGPLDTQVPEKKEGEIKYESALNQSQALEAVRNHNFEVLDLCTKLLLQRCHMKITEAVSHATEFAGTTSAVLYQNLDPRRTGEYQRALKIGEQYGVLILERYMDWNGKKAKAVVRKLVEDYPSHSYVLDIDELQSLELPAIPADKGLATLLNEVRDLLLMSDDDTLELVSSQSKLKALTEKVKNERSKKSPTETA